jgi:riboflavin transporter FmnP
MKFLVCLLLILGVAYGARLPFKPNCANAICTMNLQICPDGSPAPVPAGECCQSMNACKPKPVKPISNCRFVMCAMVIQTCSDGTPAPIPAGGCCPSLSACKPKPIQPTSDCLFAICTLSFLTCPDGTPAPTPAGECCPSLTACNSRNNPLSSLLSGSNILQTLTNATHGTNLGSVLSILNLLNNVHQLTNDIHQIPLLINQTLAAIVNGTGQAGQIIIDQLIGAVTNVVHPNVAQRNLLSSLGQNANLLSSITHLLPQGTSISTILSILNLLGNVNALNNDIHQIPALINQTLTSLVAGAGQAGGIVVQQLLNLLGPHTAQNRNLLSALGQNANLLSSITHLLPQGTSISSILSILNLLNNVNQLGHDIHQIPALINQTLASLVTGAGQASGIIVQQLLNLVGIHQQAASRNLLSSLGQNANLLASISHLLPQGTSISTILSLLNLLGNVNALNNDLHQIPALLNQTLASIINGTGQAGQIVIDQLIGAITNVVHPNAAQRNLLSALGQNANLLSSITHLLPQGTSISTILSILNLLGNVNALNNDIHQIPALINQTLASLVAGAGQASGIVVQQLLNLVGIHSQAANRNLLSSLGQNANLLSSITHLLPQGTSISTILSILNLLGNVNALNNDLHQIPALLNQTLTSLVAGAGQAGGIVVQQLLNLLGPHTAQNRNLLSALGQNANLLSSITHLLPQGTSISTILSILNLLGNVNALNNDLHQIPALINQTLASLVAGAGQASGIVVQQLLNLVGIHSQAANRNLLSSLGQNANLLASITHLLPQGTSISTVLSLLNLLGNVNALNNDLHQIPAVLQETLQSILSGIQNLLPPTIQPIQGSF